MTGKDYFGGTVSKGVLTLDDPIRWRGVLAHHEGRRVTITVRREQQVRTLAQNRYYWSVVVPIFGEWSGEDKDAAHETLKSLHLVVEHELPTGELVRKAGETKVLTIEEFSQYVERVCVWLAQQGVYVPPAGERVEASL